MIPSNHGIEAWPGSRLAGMRADRRMMERQLQEKSYNFSEYYAVGRD